MDIKNHHIFIRLYLKALHSHQASICNQMETQHATINIQKISIRIEHRATMQQKTLYNCRQADNKRKQFRYGTTIKRSKLLTRRLIAHKFYSDMDITDLTK